MTYRRESRNAIADVGRHRARLRCSPVPLVAGFVLGYSPVLYFLFGYEGVFWADIDQFEVSDIGQRIWEFLVLDAASMLELTQPVEGNPNLHRVTIRSFVNVFAYALGAYLLLRRWVRPGGGKDRLGAAYFTTVLLALIALHVFVPHRTLWTSPRFLVPAFSVTSVLLGLVAAQGLAFVGPRFRSRGGLAAGLPVAALALGSLVHFGVGWREAERHEMHWPSGHRKFVMDIVEELERRGIEKLLIRRSPNHVLLGYRLFHASRLKIRFNRNDPLGDRMEGRVDETRFGGEEYHMQLPAQGKIRLRLPDGSRATATPSQLPRGFWLRGYYVYPPLIAGEPVPGEPVPGEPVPPG